LYQEGLLVYEIEFLHLNQPYGDWHHILTVEHTEYGILSHSDSLILQHA